MCRALLEVRVHQCWTEKPADLVSFMIEVLLKTTLPKRDTHIYRASAMYQVLCYVLGIQWDKGTHYAFMRRGQLKNIRL